MGATEGSAGGSESEPVKRSDESDVESLAVAEAEAEAEAAEAEARAAAARLRVLRVKAAESQPGQASHKPNPSPLPSRSAKKGPAPKPRKASPPPATQTGHAVHSKRRVWPWVVLGVVVFFFGGCTVLVVIGSGGESGKRSTATSLTTPPGSVVIPGASLTLSPNEAKDVEFMALLLKWAKRDGYTVGDRDTLIAAGADVCASMDRGESLISSSADAMDKFGLAGKQAQAVGVAAVEVYCPEHNP